MTDDLVKRLLIAADRADTVFDPDFASPWREAADRIEDLQRNRQHWQDAYVLKTKHEIEVRERNKELEAALRFYAEYQPAFSHQDFRAVARAALGEKKDD
jgi:hypothetical protein